MKVEILIQIDSFNTLFQ